eukprot:8299537-Pyramimonas_sp.AAC.1
MFQSSITSRAKFGPDVVYERKKYFRNTARQTTDAFSSSSASANKVHNPEVVASATTHSAYEALSRPDISQNVRSCRPSSV